MKNSDQVVIAGAGPAALVAANQLTKRGLPVVIVAPNPHRRWHPIFSAWEHELTEEIPVEVSWAAPSVWTDAGESILNAKYVRVDGAAYQTQLLDALNSRRVTFINDHVLHIDHEKNHSVVHLANGSTLTARVVIDASGQDTRLTQRRHPSEPAYQMAWGEELEVEWHPWSEGEMVLMDWRGPNDKDPSFLYVQPLGKHRIFVEETSLCNRPAVTLQTLRRRLHARLERMHIVPLHAHKTERCRIAMGGGVPDLRQRTIGFGAAGGMVHPSTGYQLASSIRQAPALADVIVDHWSLDPKRISKETWHRLWPRDTVRQWELLHFGLDALCQFDRTEMSDFFETFFALDDAQWRDFLAGTATSPQMAVTMMSFFRLTTPVLRRGLAWIGLNQPPHRVLRSIVGA